MNIFQLPKLQELSRRIAKLTTELKKLKFEKDLLFLTLDHTNDVGISTIKKDISVMKNTLKKLAELDNVLKQYAELQEQATDVDADKLTDVQLSLHQKQ